MLSAERIINSTFLPSNEFVISTIETNPLFCHYIHKTNGTIFYNSFVPSVSSQLMIFCSIAASRLSRGIYIGQLGFLHSVHVGRNFLSLDLMEEFRAAFIDTWIVSFFNKCALSFRLMYSIVSVRRWSTFSIGTQAYRRHLIYSWLFSCNPATEFRMFLVEKRYACIGSRLYNID